MKKVCLFVVILLIVTQVYSETRYVWQDSPSPGGPYTSWNSAAHTIQEAVNAANVGDTVLVTNGVYDTGITLTPGYSSRNRVMIDKAITVSSVNGPAATIIEGSGPIGNSAVRCLFMDADALVSGFTLSNGYTMIPEPWAQYAGGGACIYNEGTLSNCVVTGNTAERYGGGIALVYGGKVYNSISINNTCNLSGGGIYCYHGGEVYNCKVIGNQSPRQAGLYCAAGGVVYNTLITKNSASEQQGGLSLLENGIAYNCTVVSNTAPQVGGVVTQNKVSLWNCIIYDNYAPSYPNYRNDGTGWSYNYCCTYPAVTGIGNISNNPQFISADNYRLSSVSPCINTGTNVSWMYKTYDLDSNQRIFDGIVDMGVYEYGSTSFVYSTTNYVDQTSLTPTPPYSSWATAAHTIQDAVNAANAGDCVIVTNGVYDTGITLTPGYSSRNRVMIDKPITVLSVNGPAATIIEGSGPIGTSAVRCLFMDADALVSGFTLSNGYTMTPEPWAQYAGGGACVYNEGTLSNCVVTGNTAERYGGGIALVYGGKVYNSISINNTCNLSGGGIYCYHGGEVYNCKVIGNQSVRQAGLYCAAGGRVYNTLITGNHASEQQGGLSLLENGIAFNCTVVSNTAPQVGGVVTQNKVSLWNCIIYDNYAPVNPNYRNDGSGWSYNYCCTYPMVSGTGNITNNPLFVNAVQRNYRLSAKSPCIDAGTNLPWMVTATDLDGYQRIQGRKVDIGAYESNADQYHYVSQTSTNPIPPYSSWATAALRIQDAVNSSVSGDVVVVANGVYDSGATVTPGYSALNRVMVNKPITVMSFNGPEVTIIAGDGPLGTSAVRCVYVSNNALLTGFTLSNGYTTTLSPRENYSGGGALVHNSGTISSCLVTCSQAQQYGAGIAILYGGSVHNSYVAKNTSHLSTGGIYCHQGGEVYNCTVVDNVSVRQGGVYLSSGGTIYNSLIAGNYASEQQGGLALLENGTAYNCTIVSNTAPEVGGVLTQNGVSLWNCIVYDNFAPVDSNYRNTGTGWSYNYCCTYPIVCGIGIITNDPEFVSATDFRLMPSSPCKNRGVNMDWMYTARDLNNNQRIYEGIVDMGAYEFVPEPSLCVVFLLLAFIVRKNGH